MTKQEQIAQYELDKMICISKGRWKSVDYYETRIRELRALPIEKEVGR